MCRSPFCVAVLSVYYSKYVYLTHFSRVISLTVLSLMYVGKTRGGGVVRSRGSTEVRASIPRKVGAPPALARKSAPPPPPTEGDVSEPMDDDDNQEVPEDDDEEVDEEPTAEDNEFIDDSQATVEDGDDDANYDPRQEEGYDDDEEDTEFIDEELAEEVVQDLPAPPEKRQRRVVGQKSEVTKRSSCNVGGSASVKGVAKKTPKVAIEVPKRPPTPPESIDLTGAPVEAKDEPSRHGILFEKRLTPVFELGGGFFFKFTAKHWGKIVQEKIVDKERIYINAVLTQKYTSEQSKTQIERNSLISLDVLENLLKGIPMCFDYMKKSYPEYEFDDREFIRYNPARALQ